MTGIKLAKNTAPAKVQGEGVDVPIGLYELPAVFGLKPSDIGGFTDTDRLLIADRALAGDEKAQQTLEISLQVMFELMKRDTHLREQRDSKNHLIYHRKDGEGGTLQKFTPDATGEITENSVAKEVRSKWGLRTGNETRQVSGEDMPEGGHWKTIVAKQWNDIFRGLKYRVDTPNYDHLLPHHNRDEYEEVRKRATDDDGMLRKELLAWLKPFLKEPVSTWDGQN